MDRLTDAQGRTIGYLAEGRSGDGLQRVLDANHRTVGYVGHKGTYDVHYRRLSPSYLPGLLLK